ncbi:MULTISPECIES: ATP-dependent helicase [Barnesiella]|uniref:ATP-dependent helicase n=1 Tax=Barnesiella TaxID=397864 RepID=UPI000E50B978|nr:UvrD-helicase domain-containing protein [Barnesiella intestinihominis]MBT9845116.1 AAA family ATPase [Barnesiella intestinihominis]MCM0689203.1 UvrD-helicase domain-containing protein [Barnesiella sp. B2-R-119]MDB0675810.1 UvrD-helicase domain-containing protein [Barnesiella intestinihominis]RHR96171.1 ATP-dependent DNA helicase [Bacteroides sp. AF14-46]
MEQDFLNSLNDQQREAVLYTDGPELVIAGAGSGKTRVLTYKIAHLLQMGYPPYRLLALTFTNKAANEMKERIAALVGTETAQRLWAGTFHSIFSRILRANADRLGYRHDFTIYDASDSLSLIKSIIRELQLDDKTYKPTTVQTIISQAKNDLTDPQAYARNRERVEWDTRSKRPLIHKIYQRYQQRCSVSGVMDFDDLLLNTNILFRDHPDVLQHYRNLFAYILVDEYQDTNFAQHHIVSQLGKDHNHICVVGDDAQSIYSFRGANIHNILGLSKEFPGLKIFKLERNYRSTQNIVNTANSLIAKNKEQIPKQVFSEKEQGNKVQVISAYSDFEEGFIVSNRIAEMRLTTHCDYNDFAVLYRTNAQSRELEEALRERNIPYRIYGGMSFYQRKEIKDAIAYFRLTINPDDEEALKRVINYPARGIGNTTLSKLIERAHSQESSIWKVISDPIGHNLAVNNGTLNKLKTFKDLIDELRYEADKKNTPELAETIIKRSGIWGEISSDRTPENINRQENIEELLNGVRKFCVGRKEAGEEQTSLSDFLAKISLATDQDNGDETEQDKVTLMTVHASKGLEFKQVFIVGVEEDLFPSAMSKNSEREIEEERRLLYVAITRAGENCTLTYALSRYRNGQTVFPSPSRFIKDLDSRYVDMPVQTKQESPRETISWNRFPFDTERPRKTSRWNEEDTDRTPAPRPFAAPSPGKRLTKIDSKPTGETHSTTQSTVTTAAGQVEIGTFICHARFGNGTVTAIEDTGDNCKITVEFENVGRKQLLLKFAKFTIIE